MASITSDTANTAVATSSQALLRTLTGLLPPHRPVALHEPSIGDLEKQLMSDCLDSGWISSAGQYVDRFEQTLSDYTGVAHASATVNGTAALHSCLILGGVIAEDEVLVPALTFVGTINPIRYQYAIPHFVDCEHTTLGVDAEKLEYYLKANATVKNGCCTNKTSGRVIRALLVVHVLGIPANMEALSEIAKRWRLTLIEDAAESLGSWRGTQHTGSWAGLSALSFNGNKIISSGGGGALLTDDTRLAAQAKHLTTTAKPAHPWAFRHDRVAYNYRMPNVNAALGCAQLSRLGDFLSLKKRLYDRYVSAFSEHSNVHIHQPPDSVESNHWLNLLLVPDADCRDILLQQAHDEGIQLRPLWDPMHRLPMFSDYPRDDLSRTEELWRRGVCLPSSPQLVNHV